MHIQLNMQVLFLLFTFLRYKINNTSRFLCIFCIYYGIYGFYKVYDIDINFILNKPCIICEDVKMYNIL